MSDWLDADPRRAEKLADVCFDVPEWAPDDHAIDMPRLRLTPSPQATRRCHSSILPLGTTGQYRNANGR